MFFANELHVWGGVDAGIFAHGSAGPSDGLLCCTPDCLFGTETSSDLTRSEEVEFLCMSGSAWLCNDLFGNNIGCCICQRYMDLAVHPIGHDEGMDLSLMQVSSFTLHGIDKLYHTSDVMLQYDDTEQNVSCVV
jgi:hypothetical protein|uniref:Uncharacterized protein n=1 Tax=Eutreptiella gymnastica TaxID=73025 RepID=A0A7S4CXU7_9EUGL